MENNKLVFISIIIPCFNEEETIVKVIKEVKRVMGETNYQYEIMIVDDNSTDKTVEMVENLKSSIPELVLIKRPINGGAGASRKTGIKAAKGGIIVMLDGDGTYEVPAIPRLLEYFPEYDQVNGARTSEEGTYKLLRYCAKWFIRKLAIYLTGYKIPDLNTGLKAFKKDIMLKYLWVIPDGFSCVTTMTLAFLTNGYNVKYIPTKYFKRIGKSKFHPVKDSIKYLNTVFRMIIYFKPLKFFIPLALIILLAAIIKLFYGAIHVSLKVRATEIILSVAAFQVFFFGLLADLIVSSTKREE